jgi:hypothetical protein
VALPCLIERRQLAEMLCVQALCPALFRYIRYKSSN